LFHAFTNPQIIDSNTLNLNTTLINIRRRNVLNPEKKYNSSWVRFLSEKKIDESEMTFVQTQITGLFSTPRHPPETFYRISVGKNPSSTQIPEYNV